MIGIVDCGMGNLGSIVNMLDRLGAPAVMTDDVGVLGGCDRLILPGVGAFDRGMAELHERGLVEPLTRRVLDDGVPVLGICLGMQLLARGSEEGERAGLGWIEGGVVRLAAGNGLKVPHMGWNSVQPTRASLLFDEGQDPRFYFVHSYHLVCDDPHDVIATTTYGIDIVAAVERGSVAGVQFHPEKSHRFGLELLGRFAGVDTSARRR